MIERSEQRFARDFGHHRHPAERMQREDVTARKVTRREHTIAANRAGIDDRDISPQRFPHCIGNEITRARLAGADAIRHRIERRAGLPDHDV